MSYSRDPTSAPRRPSNPREMWICPECGEYNDPENDDCFSCGEPQNPKDDEDE